jgi:L-lactate dehydrogenase complex protein LldG
VLAKVRAALGKSGDRTQATAAARAYLAAHAQGPRPAMPADLVERFLRRATDMESTVERIATLAQLPQAVARYVDALDLDPSLAEQKSHRGVCWPEFADLDWRTPAWRSKRGPTQGQGPPRHHRRVLRRRRDRHARDHERRGDADRVDAAAGHARRRRASGRIVAGMEERFALVRAERGAMPRAVNFVSGPSRTGDIEQTIVVGAHGPFRVHIVVVG